MAANNFIDLRQPNHLDFFDEDIGETLRGLKIKNYDPWIWEFTITQEAPNAVAEPRVNFTDEFNGEATPIVLYVIGEAANEDKAAGTGAIGVTIFGIDEDGNPNSEEVLMHATNATQVASTTLWKRFVGALVTTTGTGKVNAGIIQISNTGQTAVYGTIAAGENATIGTRVYIPANYQAFIANVNGMVISVPHATDEVVPYDGVILEPVYVCANNLLNKDSYWLHQIDGMRNIKIKREVITGANTYYLTIAHGTKCQDANRTPVWNIKVIMYGTSNALRGLPS